MPEKVDDSIWHLDPIAYFAMGGMVLFMGMFVVLLTGLDSPIASLCLLGGVLPGAIVTLYGVKAFADMKKRRAHEEFLKTFAAFVRNYRRIPVEDVAKKVGKTRLEVEKLLAESVDRGFLKGYVDRVTDEFVVQTPSAEQVFVGKCPTCGGFVNRWAFLDERFTCPYCEGPVDLPTAASPPPGG